MPTFVVAGGITDWHDYNMCCYSDKKVGIMKNYGSTGDDSVGIMKSLGLQNNKTQQGSFQRDTVENNANKLETTYIL